LALFPLFLRLCGILPSALKVRWISSTRYKNSKQDAFEVPVTHCVLPAIPQSCSTPVIIPPFPFTDTKNIPFLSCSGLSLQIVLELSLRRNQITVESQLVLFL